MRDRSLFALVIAVLVAAPLIGRPVIAAEILVFAIAALANNLLLGYTGLLSFGQASFFGVGGYVAGVMIVKWSAPLWLVLPAATAVSAVLAAAVGAVCVQRIGLYFIMLTFAFNQLFYFVAYSWTSVTGGEDGLPGVSRPAWLRADLNFYVFVAVLFMFCLVLMKRIVDSPWGRLFRAVRDNPGRTAAAASLCGHLKCSDCAAQAQMLLLNRRAWQGLPDAVGPAARSHSGTSQACRGEVGTATERHMHLSLRRARWLRL